MAYDVALFQLGMDLDQGSSTAQTEEKLSVCGPSVAQQQDRKDYFSQRDGERFAGTHLIIDVKDGSRLDDLQHIENTFRKCIEVAGATLLHIHMHHFTPNGGVSGVAVLAESHISIHSWPEYGYAALDIFMCGDTKPHLAVEVIREAFQPSEVIVHEHLRGRAVAIAA
jgi:S-adenosylmethionine decarboxylase